MKRTVILGASLALIASGAFAAQSGKAGDDDATHLSCTGRANEIHVKVSKIAKSVGLLTVELYRNEEETFLSEEGREIRKQFAARAPVTEVCLHAPKAGSYAMAVYHDKNANQLFDKSALGLPAEPYGVSNNPPMKFAAPKISEALFDVGKDGATVEIALRN